MFVRHRHRLPLAALALSVAAACGSDTVVGTGTAPTDRSLDAALAQLSLPALSASAGAVSGVPGAALPALTASRCAYSASAGSFACAPVTANGLTVTQSFSLLDASGAAQPAFNGATTSSVRTTTAVSGTYKDGGTSLVVDAHQELALSGLLTSTRTLNGTGVATITPTGSGIGATIATTIDNVVLPAGATGASVWPSSGSITAETRPSVGIAAPPPTLRVKITFTGSSTATVAITAPGYSQTCTVDLSSHAPSCS